MLLRAWVVGSCRTETASRHRTTTLRAPSTDYLFRTPHRIFSLSLPHAIAEEVIFFPPLSLVRKVQMLEMGVGLALRHLTPRTLREQPLTELFDCSAVQIPARLTQFVQPFEVMIANSVDPAMEIGERLAMSRQHHRHALQLVHPSE